MSPMCLLIPLAALLPLQDGASDVCLVVGEQSEPVQATYVAHVREALQSTLEGRVTEVSARELTPEQRRRDLVVIGERDSNPLIAELARRGLVKLGPQNPGPEGFVLKLLPNPWHRRAKIWIIAGADARGTLYGAYEFASQVRTLNGLPEKLNVATKPAFPIRWWETQLEDFWNKHEGGSPYWYANEHYLAYLQDVLRRAPGYRVNGLVLMGRHDAGEVHTYLSYERFPELHAIYRDRRAAERKAQAEATNRLVAEARKHGVDIYLWDHQLHVPPEVTRVYPELAGKGATLCPSQPKLWELLEAQYDEFFRIVPDIAGIVLVFAETQISLLSAPACECGTCKARKPSENIRDIITHALNACRRHGKRLVVRTFAHSHEDIQTIVDAIAEVPRDAITVMSKAVPADFYGLLLPHNPAIAAVGDRPKITEFTLAGEFRGKTHIICLPAQYYRKHIAHAAAQGSPLTPGRAGRPLTLRSGSLGAAGRIDHQQYPRSVFETPNEFNVYFVSQLLWDPKQKPSALWRAWCERHYGQRAARRVAQALQRTEATFEKFSNSLGFYSTSAHGQIPPMFRGPYNAWDNLRSSVALISATDPSRASLGQQLLQPDDELMAKIIADKEEAIRLAEASMGDLERAKPDLAPADYEELKGYLALGADCAALWRQIGEALFRGLQLRRAGEQSTETAGKLDSKPVAHLATVCNELLAQAYALEAKHGAECWPVYPHGRGTTAYECVVGMYADFMDVLAGKEPRPLGGWKPAERPDTSPEILWRALLTAARGGGQQECDVTLDGGIRTCEFTSSGIVATGVGGALLLPTGVTSRGPMIRAGREYHLVIRANADGITVAQN